MALKGKIPARMAPVLATERRNAARWSRLAMQADVWDANGCQRMLTGGGMPLCGDILGVAIAGIAIEQMFGKGVGAGGGQPHIALSEEQGAGAGMGQRIFFLGRFGGRLRGGEVWRVLKHDWWECV